MIRIIDYRSSMAAYFNEYHEWRVSLGYRSEDTNLLSIGSVPAKH